MARLELMSHTHTHKSTHSTHTCKDIPRSRRLHGSIDQKKKDIIRTENRTHHHNAIQQPPQKKKKEAMFPKSGPVTTCQTIQMYDIKGKNGDRQHRVYKTVKKQTTNSRKPQTSGCRGVGGWALFDFHFKKIKLHFDNVDEQLCVTEDRTQKDATDAMLQPCKKMA